MKNELEYRRLTEGEIVLATDECQHENGEWRPVQGYVGLPAPDPKYPAHCQFRRKTMPTLPRCECLKCCDGEHVGSCRECAGWGESDCEPCEYCDRTGVCPKCHGGSLPVCTLCDLPIGGTADLAEYEKNGAHVKCAEKELTGDVISLCKCAVRRHGIAICPQCEKPYSADGHVFTGRHA